MPFNKEIIDEDYINRRSRSHKDSIGALLESGKLLRKDIRRFNGVTEDIYSYEWEGSDLDFGRLKQKIIHLHVFRDKNNDVLLFGDLVPDANGEEQEEFYSAVEYAILSPKLLKEYRDTALVSRIEPILKVINERN